MDLQYGKVVFECYTCDATLETDTKDFVEALTILRENEWGKKKNRKNKWRHFCPDCWGRTNK